ncbi:MAG: translation initiation factor IF-2 [Candidatus Zambryskibacteria bacterium]|nr:translation initiation factor IF-2 [Candidatus Zambryskibacteria bacterium]
MSKEKTKRPPIVVVMGHIDHGKSTLLDYIRKTNTTEKEVGGITQHISAYEATCDVSGKKRKITFLDTPGHEAFCAIRARGAKVADLAILVVSTEDGVKTQTIEALDCIRTDKIPFIVALNKIDSLKADLNKTRQDLAEHEIIVEGWGGIIPAVAISAKTGEGIPELLEMVTLQADLEEFYGDPELPAEGYVIESNLNPQQGISTTLIIKNGSLKIGQFLAVPSAYTPVRTIEDYKGDNIKEAGPSCPIRIMGWNAGPKVGSHFVSFQNKEEAIKYAQENKQKECNSKCIVPEGCQVFNVIIKADTSGSLDAVEHELQKLNNDKTVIKIISKDVGIITEKDIKMATIKNSLVLGFNVGTDKSAEVLAMRDNTEIKTFRMIYDLIDYAKEKMAEITPTETKEIISGIAKILKTFSQNKDKQVVGGKVGEGVIKSGEKVKIFRKEEFLGEGKIKELQIKKTKTGEVKEGQEFGMMIESKIEIIEKDTIKSVLLTK